MAKWRDTIDHGAVLYSERPCGHYSVWPEGRHWCAYYDATGQAMPMRLIGKVDRLPNSAEGLSAAKILCREHLDRVLSTNAGASAPSTTEFQR